MSLATTRPASIAARARARLSNSPRSTRSTSMRLPEGDMLRSWLSSGASAPFASHAYANFERGQVLPDISGLCPRQNQRHPMEFELMDHHQIAGVAEIFNGQTVAIDQPAVASLDLRELADAVG